jgi:hypothetical protein
MILKGRGRGLFKILFQRLLEGNEETHKNLSQDSRFPRRDLKPEPPK